MIAVNKWDLSSREQGAEAEDVEEDVRDAIRSSWPTRRSSSISAADGRGHRRAAATPPSGSRAAARRASRPGQLNRLLPKATAEHPPKAAKGNKAVQDPVRHPDRHRPADLRLSLNHPVDLHFSYKRYLENQIREEFGFEGTPIVLQVRTRRH